MKLQDTPEIKRSEGGWNTMNEWERQKPRQASNIRMKDQGNKSTTNNTKITEKRKKTSSESTKIKGNLT